MTIAQKLREERREPGELEGLLQSELEGRLEMRRQTVLRLFARRFGTVPAAVQCRVRIAGAPELKGWLDQAVEAPTLDAVLASLH